MEKARTFAFQLGAVVCLYVSVGALITLAFGVITLAIPDPAAGSYERSGAMSSIRFAIATLVVFFPAYLVITRFVNQARRAASESYLGLTRWLLYLTLLVAGLVVLGSLASVLYSYLSGELTARFLAKAATLVGILLAGLTYYWFDVRGYWVEHVRQSLLFGAGVSLVVGVLVVTGLMLVDSPAEVREKRLDSRQVEDLQNVQWQIESHLQAGNTLEPSLADYYTEQTQTVPSAPGDRPAYRYEVGDNTFRLCATFAHDSDDLNQSPRTSLRPNTEYRIHEPFDWEYTAGEYCFERTVATASTTESAAANEQ